MIGVRGYLSGCVLAACRLYRTFVPVLAQDNSSLAAGKEAWAQASCSVSWQRAQGGDGGELPCWPQPQEHQEVRQRDDER